MATEKKSKFRRSPQEQTFMDEARKDSPEEAKKPMLLRFTPQTLARMDRAAKRLLVTRSAFIYSSIAEKLERMEA